MRIPLSEKKSSKRPGRAGGGAPAGAERPASAAGAAAGPTSPMNVGLLEQIVKLMAANDLNTVDVRDGDQRIVLKRGAAFAAQPMGYAPMPAAMPAPAPAASPGAAPSGAAAGAGATAAPGGDEESKLVAVKSPMVGTFYTAPKPGEKPFVTVGSTVDEDTDICLVEAMKNYFPVKAGVRGTIARVLVQDGQTVQFDQPMFLVKPA